MYIIYHSNDFDGIFSGAVIYHFYKSLNPILIGWDYGDPIPEIPENEELWIVDLSIPELMNYPNLTWIDHHVSAINKYNNTIQGYRIDGVAACRLCWAYCTCKMLPEKQEFIDRLVQEPLSITLVGEHDIWDHHDPRALQFQYGLESEQESWSVVELEKVLLNLDVDRLCKYGKNILQWQQNYAAKICKERSYMVEFEGHKFRCLCSVHATSSVWFPQNSLTGEEDGLLVLRYQGNTVKCSLYGANNKQINMSEIAQKYGGGGHFSASGFEITINDALQLELFK